MVSWMEDPKIVVPRSKEVYSQRALDLHFSSLVVDTHADTISRYVDDGEDLATETGRGTWTCRAFATATWACSGGPASWRPATCRR